MKLVASALCFMICITLHDAFKINNPIKIGKLSNKHHNLGGDVYVLNNNKILIKDFTYDGTGPDAFFFVGESGNPSEKGTIVPYPDDQKCYDYNDQSAPILTEAYDGKDITLTLPCSLEITRVKWFSVWCRAFNMDFGSIMFPNDLKLDEDTESNPDYEPEPYVEDEPYADVEPESREAAPESEVEPETEVEPEVEPEGYLSGQPDAEPETEPEAEG